MRKSSNEGKKSPMERPSLDNVEGGGSVSDIDIGSPFIITSSIEHPNKNLPETRNITQETPKKSVVRSLK